MQRRPSAAGLAPLLAQLLVVIAELVVGQAEQTRGRRLVSLRLTHGIANQLLPVGLDPLHLGRL